TILINKEVDCPEGKALIISTDPFADYNKLTRMFSPFEEWTETTATSATIGEGTIVHPNAVIGPHVSIGKNCVIHSGVVLYDHTSLGDNVIIHANTVIGGDAFYYKKRESGYDKMHTCGSVEIGDDVEIGALCTIDRGVSGATVVGAGSKFDDHVHIGHDTVIGKRCLFAAQVGIAGCVVIDDDVTLWGQVGVVSDVTIGKNVIVFGQSGIMNDLAPNEKYFGSPAVEAREKFKELAMLRKLPGRVDQLEKKEKADNPS
ncbi:MAG: UDP-3-O-(3-hydroxymyristoyl)glucosamine N-acyltransferase, partial [Flavobacteriales bacterium]|nr:UDP-3-O-(3-hydroxymyristoyl)glucosamine N-acyltransferase [Flavobacteriales bacterium]